MAARTDTEAQQMQASSSTGITPEFLRERLVEGVGATFVDVRDLSGGCGQMFEATIVSPQFKGKGKLARHRLVNAAVKEEVAAIHAWGVKCYTEEEWGREGK